MPDDTLLTASQVGTMLGRNRTSVWRMSAEALPYVMRGAHRRYRREDVLAYLDQRPGAPGLADRVSRLEERVDRLEQA